MLFQIPCSQPNQHKHGSCIFTSTKLENLERYRINATALQHIRSNYYSFIVTREPIERLVAAYHDIFRIRGRETKARRRMVQKIIHTYRESPDIPVEFNTFGNEQKYWINFSEYIEYVIDMTTAGKYEREWEPQHRICNPCSIQYR